MKKALFFLFLVFQTSLVCGQVNVFVGPHFNYTRLEFDNPSYLEGYMGGVTAGASLDFCSILTGVVYEGSWNAARFTGDPCERSSLQEHFVEWFIGAEVFDCSPCTTFIPYIGFGYNRFENEQNPHKASLCYTYDKLFVPVGFYFFWDFCPCMNAGLQFEWRPDVYSCLHLTTFDFNTTYENAFRVQLPITGTYDSGCRHFDLSVVPFFDWNQFGHPQEASPNGVMVGIPKLTRWNVGLRVLLGYHF